MFFAMISNRESHKLSGHNGILVIVLKSFLPEMFLFSLNCIIIISLLLAFLLIGNPHM